jgi:hypothetical protein
MPENQYREPPDELSAETRTKGVLFHDGDIVELGEQAEDAEHDAG